VDHIPELPAYLILPLVALAVLFFSTGHVIWRQSVDEDNQPGNPADEWRIEDRHRREDGTPASGPDTYLVLAGVIAVLVILYL